LVSSKVRPRPPGPRLDSTESQLTRSTRESFAERAQSPLSTYEYEYSSRAIYNDVIIVDVTTWLCQGGYIFYAGGSLAGAGYCRQCRRRPAILPLQLWLCCQVCVSSPILHLLSSHWATSVVRTRVICVANVGDSLRRLCSLQHRIYNLLGLCTYRRQLAQGNGGDCTTTKTPHRSPPPCEEMDPATILLQMLTPYDIKLVFVHRKLI